MLWLPFNLKELKTTLDYGLCPILYFASIQETPGHNNFGVLSVLHFQFHRWKQYEGLWVDCFDWMFWFLANTPDEPALHSIPISWPYGLEVIQNLQIIPVKREYNHNSLLRTNHMVNVVAPALHQPFILHCSSMQCSLQHTAVHSRVPKTRGGSTWCGSSQQQQHGPIWTRTDTSLCTDLSPSITLDVETY